MKTFFAATLALAAAVTAAPALEARGCTPATYSCTADAQGWQVCDTTGNWVVRSSTTYFTECSEADNVTQYAGDCPPNTQCEFYAPSGSPYCVPQGFTFPTKA